jgi:hypothetical protein
MQMQEEEEVRVCTGQRIIGAAHGQRTDTDAEKDDKEEEEGDEEEEEEEEEEGENRGVISQFFKFSFSSRAEGEVVYGYFRAHNDIAEYSSVIYCKYNTIQCSTLKMSCTPTYACHPPLYHSIGQNHLKVMSEVTAPGRNGIEQRNISRRTEVLSIS